MGTQVRRYERRCVSYMVLQSSEIQRREKFAELIYILGNCAHVQLTILTIRVWCNKMSFMVLFRFLLQV